jgi:hypothetical protein
MNHIVLVFTILTKALVIRSPQLVSPDYLQAWSVKWGTVSLLSTNKRSEGDC